MSPEIASSERTQVEKMKSAFLEWVRKWGCELLRSLFCLRSWECPAELRLLQPRTWLGCWKRLQLVAQGGQPRQSPAGDMSGRRAGGPGRPGWPGEVCVLPHSSRPRWPTSKAITGEARRVKTHTRLSGVLLKGSLWWHQTPTYEEKKGVGSMALASTLWNLKREE